MTLDEMVAKISAKIKMEDATARRAIREVLASIKEEVASAAPESRVSIPTLGVFVPKAATEGGKARILFHLAQQAEKPTPVKPLKK